MAGGSYTPITATGTYAVYLDYLVTPPNTSYAVEFAAGTTGTFTVSYTLDDPNPGVGSPNVGWTPIWLNDPSAIAQTGSLSGTFQFPIRGIRVVFAALGGSASAMFAVLQGMSAR